MFYSKSILEYSIKWRKYGSQCRLHLTVIATTAPQAPKILIIWVAHGPAVIQDWCLGNNICPSLSTLVASSQQWTSHGSISARASQPCLKPLETHSHQLDHPRRSSCFLCNSHLSDQADANTNKCRKMADFKVLTEVDGFPACTLGLRNPTEAGDKENYQVF